MRTARVDFGGVVKEASLACVPEAGIGDYVLVHVGFALSRVDETEARKIFEYLHEMQELADSLGGPPEKAGDGSGPGRTARQP